MSKSTILVAAALAVSLGLAGTAAAKPGNGHGGGKGRPGAAKADLVNPGVDLDASGKIDVKHFPAVGKRAERSWLRLKLKHLDAAASYSLWMDDPTTVGDATLVQVADVTLTTNDDGRENLSIDTKHGGVLPFGATLATLAGMTFEVRNAADAAVLTGSVPAIQ